MSIQIPSNSCTYKQMRECLQIWQRPQPLGLNNELTRFSVVKSQTNFWLRILMLIVTKSYTKV